MVFCSAPHASVLLLLTAALACGPKSDGNDDAGDETRGSASTDDAMSSSGGSDPTMPTASGTATAGTATSATATSATTTSADGGEGPTATASSAGTIGTSATSATDSGEDTGFDPPVVPCEGEGEPLVGITTKIGYLQSQVPPRPDPTGTGGSSSGGGELDPGTLLIKLSDQAVSCEDPNALLKCGKHWEVTIVIPPEFQSPGVFNLLGPDVRGIATETGAGAGEDCSFGGGSFDATFQILAIDDQTVEARLCNVNDLFFDTDPQLEGSFSAARCPL